MGLFSWLKAKKEAGPAAAPQAAPGADDERAPDEALGDEPADLETLQRALDSRVGAARVDAARILLEAWRMGDAAAATLMVERLPALLEDPEPQARQAALAAVRMMRKQENLEKYASAVLAALADPAAIVRTSAVWAAIKLPGEVARTQVRALLGGSDEALRFDAASALAEVQDSAALPALTGVLREGHRLQEALSALMSLGDPAALPALSELWEAEDEGAGLSDFDRTALAAALARFGDARGKQHLSLRAAAGGDDRPVAVEWCGRLGVQEAAPTLLELAREQGDLARGAALRALGRLKAPEAQELLLGVAHDAELADDLRMDACEGLAELGGDPALAALRDLGAGQGEVADLCKDLLAELAAAEAQRAAADAVEKPVAD